MLRKERRLNMRAEGSPLISSRFFNLFSIVPALFGPLGVACGAGTGPYSEKGVEQMDNESEAMDTEGETFAGGVSEIPWEREYGGTPNRTTFSRMEAEVWDALSSFHHCRKDDRFVSAARHHAEALLMSPSAVTDGSADQLRFTLEKLGAYDYGIESAVVTLDPGARQFLTELVRRQGAEWTHCGLGIASRDNRTLAVWIGVHRAVELRPFGICIAPGTRPILTVRPADRRNADIQLFLGLPDTTVVKQSPVTKNAKGEVLFELEVTAKGRYELELLYDTGHGPETVLLVPFFVGVPPDLRATLAPDVKTAGGADSEETLLSLLNTARAKVNLPPLKRDRRLDAAARKHSEDMAENGFFGHVSPLHGGPAKRLNAANIFLKRSGENIAAAATPHRIHRNLMGSPAHRINMLNVLFTHVGIGVAKKDDMLFGTEIYGAK